MLMAYAYGLWLLIGVIVKTTGSIFRFQNLFLAITVSSASGGLTLLLN